jgi:predicted  nucleic acid-binding Zn-ribbon protein
MQNAEMAAFQDLEKLVRRLTEELASFRKRALQAEAKLKAYEASAKGDAPTPERARALQSENQDLRHRLEVADARAKQMLDRVRFLRQQHEEAAS